MKGAVKLIVGDNNGDWLVNIDNKFDSHKRTKVTDGIMQGAKDRCAQDLFAGGG